MKPVKVPDLRVKLKSVAVGKVRYIKVVPKADLLCHSTNK